VADRKRAPADRRPVINSRERWMAAAPVSLSTTETTGHNQSPIHPAGPEHCYSRACVLTKAGHPDQLPKHAEG